MIYDLLKILVLLLAIVILVESIKIRSQIDNLRDSNKIEYNRTIEKLNSIRSSLEKDSNVLKHSGEQND